MSCECRARSRCAHAPYRASRRGAHRPDRDHEQGISRAGRDGPSANVGAYEKLRGKAYGEVDPADPRNAVITDIQLAPRNANGKVTYSMDIFILKPIDLTKGNHRLFIDVNNRGTMRWDRLNNGSNVNNPIKAADAGTGFLMNLGYTIVGNGWDMRVTPEEREATRITVPMAKNPDGSIDHRAFVQVHQFRQRQRVRYKLAYPAATMDKSKATLTLRARLDDQADDGAARVTGNTSTRRRSACCRPARRSRQSHIYEFMYTAKDPVVAGLGLAATRDFVSFLRHAAADDSGNPESAGRQHSEHFLLRHFAAGAVHQRFPDLGLQPGRKRSAGHRRRAELDRRRQHRQHQLPVRADRQN